jgi:hypothetical protein
MSRVAKLFLAATLVWFLSSAALAQLTVSPTPLTISDPLETLQAPAYATFADPYCDRDGSIYMRHDSSGEDASEIAKISADGTVELTRLAAVPGFGDMHAFATAATDGGAVHQIVRAWDTADRSGSPSIYYLQFSPDGSFRSRQEFAHEFIPSMLLPLPSGDFFAAGVLVKKFSGRDNVEEVPLAGIFDSDAQFRTKLQSTLPKSRVATAESSSYDKDTDEALQQGGHVTLGDDGNIYVLLSDSKTRVRVYRQTGGLLREMSLQQPFQEGLATGVWVSSGRVLITYEGEADDPKDVITYIVYDAATGQLIRAFRPQFSGSVACFEDGQSLTVLVNQKYSGQLAIGTVELQ